MSRSQTPLSIEQIQQAAYLACIMDDVLEFICEHANKERMQDLEASARELAAELRVIACNHIVKMPVLSAYPQPHIREA